MTAIDTTIVLIVLRGVNSDETAEGTVEESEIDGEGDLVVVLAGDPVIEEESFLAKLGDGLDSIGVEEVVEEENVVRGQENVADFAHFVKCRQDSFL